MEKRICRILAGTVWLIAAAAQSQTTEYRAFSIDAWNNDFNTGPKCTAVINNLRSANINTLFVEVRRRGDAFYNSNYEPKNPAVASDFDPLADLLAKAHDTSGGKQKIEIHAWIVTYHVWKGSRPPSEPTHPVAVHPEWLLKDINGQTLIDGQYTFDPGHPDVQRHTFNVCMDIITNYNVDGLNFDYVRYSGLTEGYNEVTVARFNKRFGRTGSPAPDDAIWKQFRRDQVTALVRKVYLNSVAVKPNVKISADTITWAPGVTSPTEWTNNSSAYTKVLQDWRGWMEEGILDINMPMNYFREADPQFALDYRKWSDFAVHQKHNRHAIINAGIYLNSVSNGLVQMRYPRQATARGMKAEGMAGYDYRKTNKDGVSNLDFFKALTSTNSYETNASPLFAQRAEVPEMPWKTKPTKGHLKGFITSGKTTNYLDGADISITGAVTRNFISDATGFFGSVDLPPGSYVLTASSAGHNSVTVNFVVKPGVVTNCDVLLLTAEDAERPERIKGQ